MLTDAQIERYSRQIILPQVGGKGQEKLLRARVLVNGNTPVQTSALFYLAAAGVGTIGVLAQATDSVFSVLASDQKDPVSCVLTRLNPDCAVVIHKESDLLHRQHLVQQYDFVLSTPDDALHQACYASRRPFVCAQVSAGEAWLFSCRGYEPDLPCLQCCALPVGEDSASASLTETAALFLGTLQATEAIKLILGLHHASSGKLLHCQFPALHFSESIVKKDPGCPLCTQCRSQS